MIPPERERYEWAGALLLVGTVVVLGCVVNTAVDVVRWVAGWLA